MERTIDKAVKAFDFLTSNEGNVIRLKEMADEVGWKPSTIRTYATKKWKNYLIPTDKGRYKVQGLKYLSLEDFLKLHAGQPDEDHEPKPVDRFYYDVCLSFAQEDFERVEPIATILQSYGVRVYMDPFQNNYLWGQGLFDHYQEIFYRFSQYVVLFVSRNLANKLWTDHQRMRDQTDVYHAFRKQLIVTRLDQTEIPLVGDSEPVDYFNIHQWPPVDSANGILVKLGRFGSIQDLLAAIRRSMGDSYHIHQVNDQIMFTPTWSDDKNSYQIKFPINVLLAFWQMNKLDLFLESDEFFPVTY